MVIFIGVNKRVKIAEDAGDQNITAYKKNSETATINEQIHAETDDTQEDQQQTMELSTTPNNECEKKKDEDDNEIISKITDGLQDSVQLKCDGEPSKPSS